MMSQERLEALAEKINLCRKERGCGHPPCGEHAVGKPTHQAGTDSGILVVGEAPAADGWWRTGRPFYRETSSGLLELSRTGANLNKCLTILGTAIERVGFVEAVRCRPSSPAAWRSGERVRQRCRGFLLDHFLATKPTLVLPLGLIAALSCLEVTVGRRPDSLDAVVGVAVEWAAPWGCCWILPLFHPSPANGGRWPHNMQCLREFLETHPECRPTAGSGALPSARQGEWPLLRRQPTRQVSPTQQAPGHRLP
jgi:uracil-DNA glycosylase family 4